jgi:hypothetical protein
MRLATSKNRLKQIKIPHDHTAALMTLTIIIEEAEITENLHREKFSMHPT